MIENENISIFAQFKNSANKNKLIKLSVCESRARTAALSEGVTLTTRHLKTKSWQLVLGSLLL